ncbi:hypothetical protein [Kocuria arenosa]|uniref:hypothetical protein n=1 Tax=Kocuria arenosa TaxID=3071446 RepID=UPI0034D61E0E
MSTFFGEVDWLPILVLYISQILSVITMVVYVFWVLILWIIRKIAPTNTWVLHKKTKRKLRWANLHMPPAKQDAHNLVSDLRGWQFIVSFIALGTAISFAITTYMLMKIPEEKREPEYYEFTAVNIMNAVFLLVYCFIVPVVISAYFLSKRLEYKKPHTSLALSAVRLIKNCLKFKPESPAAQHHGLVNEVNVFCKNARNCGVADNNPQLLTIRRLTADGQRNYWKPFQVIFRIQSIVALVYSGQFTNWRPKGALMAFFTNDQSKESSRHILTVIVAIIPLIVVLIDATIKILENLSVLGE